MSEKRYYVIAYYLFAPIEDPHAEVAKHLAFFEGRDIKSRIYISYDGINSQMSAEESCALEYMEWMRQDPRFREIDFKIHRHHEQVFPRATVKFRKQLVALDHDANPHEGGERLSPAEWRKMLENKSDDVVVIDVRNDYEWKIGHFEGSLKPQLDMFRKFPEYAEELKKEHDPKKIKVMMCCTGGIRCELYSALMKDKGFENVYQLDGGIIKYGLEQGNAQWKGKLFVFDDRLAVSLGEGSEVISSCSHCGDPSDLYHNCANMDCNELFLSCLPCAEKFAGCCKEACQDAPRVREYEKTAHPKPFRRKHLCTTCCE